MDYPSMLLLRDTIYHDVPARLIFMVVIPGSRRRARGCSRNDSTDGRMAVENEKCPSIFCIVFSKDFSRSKHQNLLNFAREFRCTRDVPITLQRRRFPPCPVRLGVRCSFALPQRSKCVPTGSDCQDCLHHTPGNKTMSRAAP